MAAGLRLAGRTYIMASTVLFCWPRLGFRMYMVADERTVSGATIGKSWSATTQQRRRSGCAGEAYIATQDVKLCKCTAVRCRRCRCKESLVGGSPPPPVLITLQTTALQHPGFPGRPSCSRIENEASCALWVRVVVSLGAGGEREVVR